MIKWNSDGLGWKWFSPTTYAARYRKIIDSRSAIPPDSATERAFSGATPDASGFHYCGSTAATWFPFVKDRSRRNELMIEEAVSLGRFGVLTLLYPESGSYGSSW